MDLPLYVLYAAQTICRAFGSISLLGTYTFTSRNFLAFFKERSLSLSNENLPYGNQNEMPSNAMKWQFEDSWLCYTPASQCIPISCPAGKKKSFWSVGSSITKMVDTVVNFQQQFPDDEFCFDCLTQPHQRESFPKSSTEHLVQNDYGLK